MPLSRLETEIVRDAAASAHAGAVVRWRVTLRPRAVWVSINGKLRRVFFCWDARAFQRLCDEARALYQAEVERLKAEALCRAS